MRLSIALALPNLARQASDRKDGEEGWDGFVHLQQTCYVALESVESSAERSAISRGYNLGICDVRKRREPAAALLFQLCRQRAGTFVAELA